MTRIFDIIDGMLATLRAANEAGQFTPKFLELKTTHILPGLLQNLPALAVTLEGKTEMGRGASTQNNTLAIVQVAIVMKAESLEESQRQLDALATRIQRVMNRANPHWSPAGTTYDLNPQDVAAGPAIRAFIRCEVKYHESEQ